MGILTYKGDKFYLDGKPYTVISGAIHYFRVPREYWHDRLLKIKECGFNTVETYTCWNLHEPREDEFDFSGNLDIDAFITCAEELGLNVILRPGPYICAEWEFGGLPSWLLTYEKMELRCFDPVFISKVRRYYGELLERIRPHLAVNGGGVFMLQIENEYGSYGNDKNYLNAIVDIYRENNIDCLFFTSDGPTKTMLSGGTLDEYLCVANFGSDPEERFPHLREFRPDQPLMCGEFWCGWFDHWFEEHHVRPADEIVKDFSAMLNMDASVNFYMFHGGTNFGFTNGANYSDKYEPTITSYDYNCPLNEAGDRTDTYYRIRSLMEERFGKLPEMTAKDSEKAAYGKVKLDSKAALLDNIYNISNPVKTVSPKYMEDIGQDFGYTLYRAVIEGPKDDWPMEIDVVHDRAQVFVNGQYKGVYERWNRNNHPDIRVPLEKGETADLDILVENMGRVNYGPKLLDHKGIRRVRFGNQCHFGWEMFPIDMRNLSGLMFEENTDKELQGPVFLRGNLRIDNEPHDTFLRLDGFTKGFVMVNGTNIGRYFNPAGPQKTLYVPAPFLKEGDNEIIVFESDSTASAEIEFLDEPDLG